MEARARAHRGVRKTSRRLHLLQQASQKFSTILDVEPLLSEVVEQTRHLLGTPFVWLWLVDSETGGLACRKAVGPQGEVMCEGHVIQFVSAARLTAAEPVATQFAYMPAWDRIAGWVASARKSIVIPDDEGGVSQIRLQQTAPAKGKRAQDPAPVGDLQTDLDLRSWMGVPLQAGERLIGVLEVADVRPGRFSSEDLSLLESLADAAAVAIDNASLVQALQQRIDQLEAENEELESFAHTVAHQLKGSLSLLTGFSELVEEEYSESAPSTLGKSVHAIAQTARKLARVVDELLLLPGIRYGQVEMKPVEMAGTVDSALERLADMIAEYHADIAWPQAWPDAVGYAPWIEEVWINYISNAIKHGGRPPRVQLGATREQGHVCFWVRDNGPGLAPDEQAHLFAPFTEISQVHLSGYGLGLGIVRYIVEKLGGSVGVDSQVGQGSVFSFTLSEREESLPGGEPRQNGPR